MKLENRTGTCTEETFWECVAEINWPGDSCKIKRSLLHAWDQEFAASFDSIYREKLNAVSKALEDHEDTLDQDARDAYYLSDDGLSDFIAHVVGMGKDVFEDETSNPKKMIKRASKRDYQENFGYCIPDGERDWRSLESQAHVRSAVELHDETAAFLAQIDPSTDAEHRAAKLAAILAAYFQNLIAERTQDALKMSEQALSAWWELYHIEADLGELRSKDAALLPMANAKWYGENVINDHRHYMGDLDKFRCEYHLRQLREKAA